MYCIHESNDFERCRKCEANGSGPLFKRGIAMHLKSSTHDCKIGGDDSIWRE